MNLPIELYGKLLLHAITAVNLSFLDNDQCVLRNDPCKIKFYIF